MCHVKTKPPARQLIERKNKLNLLCQTSKKDHNGVLRECHPNVNQKKFFKKMCKNFTYFSHQTETTRKKKTA